MLSDGQTISYSLRVSKRARVLSLAIHPGGLVVVTVPPGFSVKFVDDFIRQHTAWILKKVSVFSKLKPVSGKRSTRHDYLKYKEQARQIATERLTYFNQFYNFKIGRVAIRDQKTRWGSCSQKGNLNFSYKIALLPPVLADYIIVHELCHVGEFNHSLKFWDLVAQTIPNHKDLRRELRKVNLN